MSDVDILTIDSKIRGNFEKEFENLKIYKEKLSTVNKSLEKDFLKPRVSENLKLAKYQLENYINDVETKNQYHYYLIETSDIIDKYREILKVPVKMSFMGKNIKKDSEKDGIVQEYLSIASKYTVISTEKPLKSFKIICSFCKNSKDFDIIDGDVYICNKCYTQQTIIKHTSSYNDIERVNISSKYMYDRKVHFKDCMNQYQGKQNSTIPKKVYSDLTKKFQENYLLQGDENSKNSFRYANITKNHILMFLKELEYSSHYENVNLIHYNLTEIKPDDIRYLEDQLLEDFDCLTELYDKVYKNINRKNFINTQYVLYQLLRRHKHPCNEEEFIILKTIDRKFFHDDVCETLFVKLNWNHYPFY
jgi:hypothetical protein